MSLQSDISRIAYAGNGSTVTPYVVPFVFLENSHLMAVARTTAGVETDIALTGHTGAGNPNGGTVRTATAVDADVTLVIYRVVPETQTTSYLEGGDFPAASHERALDKLTMIAQQLKRAMLSSFRGSEAVSIPPIQVGDNNLLMFTAAGVIGLTPDQVRSILGITTVNLDVDAGIRTFINDSARTATVPDFIGQVGSQQDTGELYIATGNGAGSWTAYAVFNIAPASVNTPDKLVDGVITTPKMADEAVTPAKLSPEVGANAWRMLDANATALPGDRIAADTSVFSFALTLPAAPQTGCQITIKDVGRAFGDNNLTIARNGNTIEGLSEDMQADVTGAEFRLFYTGTTWRVS